MARSTEKRQKVGLFQRFFHPSMSIFPRFPTFPALSNFGPRGCGGIGRAAQRGHPVRCFKVPLVRPPRAPGPAPPTLAAPEPISLPLARRTPPQRHDRMARAHGACGARTLRHGWVLDFNDLIARVRDKVAAAECRRAFLKCEIAILRALLSGRGLGAVVVACAR